MAADPAAVVKAYLHGQASECVGTDNRNAKSFLFGCRAEYVLNTASGRTHVNIPN
jgi:hypothetical protein